MGDDLVHFSRCEREGFYYTRWFTISIILDRRISEFLDPLEYHCIDLHHMLASPSAVVHCFGDPYDRSGHVTCDPVQEVGFVEMIEDF